MLSNEQGAAWISLAVEDSLYIPSIYISSPALAHDLVIEPSDRIKRLLGDLQPGTLRAARDRRTGLLVLPNPDDANEVSDAIRKLMAVGPKETRPAVAGAPRLTSNVRGAWVERGTSPEPAAITQTAPASFRLTKVDGAFTLENLTSAQVEQELAEMAALPVVPMLDFGFGLGFLEDGWNWVKDKFEEVKKVIVTGAKVLLQVTIGGIPFVYDFVMDTLGAVFNAIDMVLDYAGVLLGTALGWLLEFLFDWSAVKRRRDQLRDAIYQQARGVPTFISDPKIALTSFADQLQSARDTLSDKLKDFESSKPARTSLGTLLADTPVLGALLSPGFDLSAGSLLPEMTWLLDKATAAFPAIGFGQTFNPGLPTIEKLDSLLGVLVSTLSDAAPRLSGLPQEVSSLGLTWISDPRLFSASTFDPVIEVAIQWVVEILDWLNAVVQAIANLLSAIWAHVDKIIDWFDQPLPRSSFGSFYWGLTGRSLSMFDLACLIAAFPSGDGSI